jgi:hypothetical protein
MAEGPRNGKLNNTIRKSSIGYGGLSEVAEEKVGPEQGRSGWCLRLRKIKVR